MGVVKSSEAMTPESLATTRSGMFSRASAPTSARQVVSYDAATCSRSGGGESGATYGRLHPAPSTRAPKRMPSLALVMVNPPIRLDEPDDPRLVELIQGLQARPRRQGNLTLQPRVGRKDHAVVVALDDRRQFPDERRALAAVLDHHPAVLQVVDLELLRDGRGVDAPRRQIRQVWAGGGGGGGVGRGGGRGEADVGGAPSRAIGAGGGGHRPIGEVRDHRHDQHSHRGAHAPPEAAPSLARRFLPARPIPFSHVSPRTYLAEACGSRTHLQLV